MNTRRQFLTSVAVSGAVVGSARLAVGQDAETKLDLADVGKFVGKSHGDLDTVKSMLAEQPALVNAAWDWGAGDWETGLGAASHVGRPDIAELLLAHGARLNAFASAMLGLTSIVAEMLKFFPRLHEVRGPHEIPLLSHAVFGRAKADEVFHLLLNAGADVNGASKIGMTPLMAAASVGRPSIVQALLSKNADPQAKDSLNRTALDFAIERDHTSVIEILKAVS